mmetsp:Transcript_21538/g.49632  ORF Transcript_21538/g.49632 Transcript_21538/m.49632 type:complete len:260 (+) Transcript_21538:416-1195(+)
MLVGFDRARVRVRGAVVARCAWPRARGVREAVRPPIPTRRALVFDTVSAPVARLAQLLRAGRRVQRIVKRERALVRAGVGREETGQDLGGVWRARRAVHARVAATDLHRRIGGRWAVVARVAEARALSVAEALGGAVLARVALVAKPALAPVARRADGLVGAYGGGALLLGVVPNGHQQWHRATLRTIPIHTAARDLRLGDRGLGAVVSRRAQAGAQRVRVPFRRAVPSRLDREPHAINTREAALARVLLVPRPRRVTE